MSGHSREDHEKGIATARRVRNLAFKCGFILFAGAMLPREGMALASIGCAILAVLFHGLAVLLSKTMPAANFHAPADSVTHAAEERAKAWERISAADQEAKARGEAMRKLMLARAKAIQDEEIKRQRRERIQYGLKRTNGREINRGPIIDITPEKS